MSLYPERDVGSLGESILESWCNQVGIIVNRVLQDKTGWDHFLEFPIINDGILTSGQSLDICLEPLKCLVQVKSTDGHPGKYPVKLDNWVHFVKNPLPTFYLVMEFNGKNNPERAFLVPVDELLINKVLKKLRKIGSKSKSNLHKKKLQFKYESKNELKSLDGKGLELAIKNHVGVSLDSYAKNKSKVVRTAGYQNKNVHLKFDISLSNENVDINEYLIDFSIGLIPYIKVEKGEARDIRFGMTSEEPFQLFGSGRIEIIQSPEKGEIILKSKNKNLSVNISTEVYLPHGIEITKGDFKARFSAAFFDFVLCSNQSGKAMLHAAYNFPKSNEKYSLSSLNQMSEIITFFTRTYCEKTEIEIKYREESICKSKLEPQTNFQFNDSFQKLARTIRGAWNVAKHFNVHKEVKLFPGELLHQENALIFMENVILRYNGLIQINIWPDSNIDVLNKQKKICVPMVAHSLIGQYHMGISAAIIEDSIFENPEIGGYKLLTTDARLCRQFICERGTEPPYSLDEAIKDVIKDYESLTEVFLLEGIHDAILN